MKEKLVFSLFPAPKTGPGALKCSNQFLLTKWRRRGMYGWWKGSHDSKWLPWEGRV